MAGSDNREFQRFENLGVNDDGKAEVQIEYVEGHRYYVTFLTLAEDGSRTQYRLMDAVGSGSSATGFHRLENSMLTLFSAGQTFTIVVANETID